MTQWFDARWCYSHNLKNCTHCKLSVNDLIYVKGVLQTPKQIRRKLK